MGWGGDMIGCGCVGCCPRRAGFPVRAGSFQVAGDVLGKPHAGEIGLGLDVVEDPVRHDDVQDSATRRRAAFGRSHWRSSRWPMNKF